MPWAFLYGPFGAKAGARDTPILMYGPFGAKAGARDTPILKAIPTLEKINNLPAAEFWKQQGK